MNRIKIKIINSKIMLTVKGRNEQFYFPPETNIVLHIPFLIFIGLVLHYEEFTAKVQDDKW